MLSLKIGIRLQVGIKVLNQSKAKEFDRETVSLDSGNAHQSISRFLNDLTSHYYAEQVMDWIEANSIFKKTNVLVTNSPFIL
jgi:prolyl-tRNA synthetase